MSNAITLTPEELFFLGKAMGAVYIDYDYVAAMKDVQTRFDFLDKEAIASLGKKGLLREGIRRKVTIYPQVEELLKPVFFGRTVSVLAATSPRRMSRLNTSKFHHFQGAVTMVTLEGGLLKLESVTPGYIEKKVLALADTLRFLPGQARVLDSAKATRLIRAKVSTVAVGTRREDYLEQDGALYRSGKDGSPAAVSREDFIRQVCGILKGA